MMTIRGEELWCEELLTLKNNIDVASHAFERVKQVRNEHWLHGITFGYNCITAILYCGAIVSLPQPVLMVQCPVGSLTATVSPGPHHKTADPAP